MGCGLFLGIYDLALLGEMPDNSSMTDISMAISSGEVVRTVRTTPLMTMEENRGHEKSHHRCLQTTEFPSLDDRIHFQVFLLISSCS